MVTPTNETENSQPVSMNEGNTAASPIKLVPFVRAPGDEQAIDLKDIQQGQLGDCFVVSSIAAVAFRRPLLFTDDLRSNPDGTYTVTLYRKSFFGNTFTPEQITVDTTFPPNGKHVVLEEKVLGEEEIWPALYEKAYFQSRGGYWVVDNPIANRFGNFFYASDVLQRLTGNKSITRKPSKMRPNDLADLNGKGYAIVVSSVRNPPPTNTLFNPNGLIHGHAYYLTDVDPTSGEVEVHNPWNWSTTPGVLYQVLSFQDFQKSFERVDACPVPA